MSDNIHAVARHFATAAETYARARPSYPDSAIEQLCGELHLSAGRTVADVGAGTGKLTLLLAARGLAVVAVEPVAEMRDRLAQTAGVTTVDGTAETTGLPDGYVDAVVAGQAWHWFDGPAALAEAARVLRATGGLATIRNEMDSRVPWVAAVGEIRHSLMPAGYPDYDRSAFVADVGAAGGWTEPTYATFDYHHPVTRDGVVDRVLSTSYIAALSPTGQAAVRARVLAALEGLPEEFPFPYVTEVCTTRRG
jgi:SAM-dependent methyltransferase